MNVISCKQSVKFGNRPFFRVVNETFEAGIYDKYLTRSYYYSKNIKISQRLMARVCKV